MAIIVRMTRLGCGLVTIGLAMSAMAQAPQVASPAISLSAETANNTSAANTFQGTFNGVPKAAHLSPLPLSSMVPNGEKTRYIAHLVPPFTLSCGVTATTCHSHPNVGYEQDSDEQVARQLTDMQRRGFSVVWLDWFGAENQHHNSVAMRTMHEAEKLNKADGTFSFIVQPDHGLVKSCGESASAKSMAKGPYPPNLDAAEMARRACMTKMLIEALAYAYKTYESSPAYLHWKGRPVVPFFWNDRLQPVDWNEVQKKTPGNPIFVFRDAKAFEHEAAGGGFAWNGQTGRGDIGLDYLSDFYKTGAKAKDLLTFGAAYAGFDDRLASWGKQKLIPRRCGMTWLDTMKASVEFQKLTGEPVPFIQVVTWNDYDEGTTVEAGINNCIVGIPAQVANGKLSWSVQFGKDKDGATGDEATIAYFRVLALTGKDELHEVKRMVPREKHEVDLAGLGLTAGQKIYVDAVGQAMVQNFMSGAVVAP